MAHKSCNSMAFSLCYDGAGHAQVSTAFILRGPLKVAARKQLVCLVVSTSNHTRHAISRAFPEHPFPPWFLPNSIGGQTSCWRELLRKTSGTFGGTCANKNHWTIVSTDKWPDKRVENSIDSICIMDAAATKSRLQGKMVNVIRSFSITGSFLDRIGNRTDARTEYIYTHTHTHARAIGSFFQAIISDSCHLIRYRCLNIHVCK